MISSDKFAAHYELKKQLTEKGFLQVTLDTQKQNIPIQCFQVNHKCRCYWLENGVIMFEPIDSQSISMDIILSCGIHGNETGPIELINCLTQNLLKGKIPVKNRVLFIIGNPAAVEKQQRFIDENLNRLFDNRHLESNTIESRRAKTLELCVEDFFTNIDKTDSGYRKRLHYDLHTTIRTSKHRQFLICPLQDGHSFLRKRIEFFIQCGINTFLLMNRASSSFSYHTSYHYQAEAFTVELGQVRTFGDNNWRELKPIYHALLNLINGRKNYSDNNSFKDINLYQVKHEIIKQSDQFILNLEEDIENFYQLPIGYQLTQDIQGGYRVEGNGEAIIFPNCQVPIGHRAGIVVKKSYLTEEVV